MQSLPLLFGLADETHYFWMLAIEALLNLHRDWAKMRHVIHADSITVIGVIGR